ncbi:MAG: DUF4238 domain-containing protein [Nostoc sp.]|uniref:DUF4238 domain-containing protein n=1 Tax=Nostoc sp. TaxID=1180 RepID=UPI002FF7F6F1
MVKKRQHFIPQCYLKNFADQNSLFVLDKIEKRIYLTDIVNIAQSRYFNDFPDSFLPEELREKEKSEDEVKFYNKIQALQCYRQTYSNEKNFELLLT